MPKLNIIRGVTTCDHCLPFAIRVADVVVTPKLKKQPGLYTVDRHCDCIFCGPYVIRMQVFDDNIPNLRRGMVIHADPKLPARFVPDLTDF